jgi:hypothetical protein
VDHLERTSPQLGFVDREAKGSSGVRRPVNADHDLAGGDPAGGLGH